MRCCSSKAQMVLHAGSLCPYGCKSFIAENTSLFTCRSSSQHSTRESDISHCFWEGVLLCLLHQWKRGEAGPERQRMARLEAKQFLPRQHQPVRESEETGRGEFG